MAAAAASAVPPVAVAVPVPVAVEVGQGRAWVVAMRNSSHAGHAGMLTITWLQTDSEGSCSSPWAPLTCQVRNRVVGGAAAAGAHADARRQVDLFGFGRLLAWALALGIVGVVTAPRPAAGQHH